MHEGNMVCGGRPFAVSFMKISYFFNIYRSTNVTGYMRCCVGRPKMRWLYDVKEDLRKMRISGWRGKARRRDEWKSVLREVKVQGSSRTVAP
jgi:hypothetical protein